MTDQFPLFEEDERISQQARPLAHRDDPVTSRIAARAMVESGELNRQQREVLAALRAWSGSTSDELAQYSGLDRYKCARRLPELTRLGFVQMVGRRESKVTGRVGVVWVVCTSGRAPAAP